MTTFSRLFQLVATGLAACAAFSASAEPVVFNGADQFAGSQVRATGDAYLQHEQFLKALKPGSAKSEGFTNATGPTPVPVAESGVQPLELVFAGQGSVTAGLSLVAGSNFDGGSVDNAVEDPLTGGVYGRFNTTDPVGYPGFFFSTVDSFTVTFGSDISAFGFYGTDFFDFNGELTVAFLDANGKSVFSKKLDAPSGSGVADNGSLNFFGIVASSPAEQFRSVLFTIKQPVESNPDALGFDDFIIGEIATTPPVDLPEPATLGLVGVSLLGLVATRRRARS